MVIYDRSSLRRERGLEEIWSGYFNLKESSAADLLQVQQRLIVSPLQLADDGNRADRIGSRVLIRQPQSFAGRGHCAIEDGLRARPWAEHMRSRRTGVLGGCGRIGRRL